MDKPVFQFICVTLCFYFVLNTKTETNDDVKNYYGSPLVLDSSCDKKSEYIAMFTIPTNITTIKANSTAISETLSVMNTTGEFVSNNKYNTIDVWP